MFDKRFSNEFDEEVPSPKEFLDTLSKSESSDRDMILGSKWLWQRGGRWQLRGIPIIEEDKVSALESFAKSTILSLIMTRKYEMFKIKAWVRMVSGYVRLVEQKEGKSFEKNVEYRL